MPEEAAPPPGQIHLHGAIQVEQLSFSYAADGLFGLKELFFAIAPGERVAIVGSTGAGKSTLVRVLLGLYQPQQGLIRYDGRPLHELGLIRLRRANWKRRATADHGLSERWRNVAMRAIITNAAFITRLETATRVDPIFPILIYTWPHTPSLMLEIAVRHSTYTAPTSRHPLTNGGLALALAALAALVAFAALPRAVLAAPGTITGTVYQDYDVSGTRSAGEPGVAGVTVTAYDAAGSTVATTTTSAIGSYTLNVPVAGIPLRVEFTGLPPGYVPGPQGSGSGTLVQFVTATAANVNLGILLPHDYCQANPQIAASCSIFGANTGSSVLRRFSYTSGTTSTSSNIGVETPAPTSLADDTQVGATWGLAYARVARQIYASAFTRRHMAFGPGGPGAIYRVDRASGSVTQFINLNALFAGNPAGTDQHTPVNRPTNSGQPLYYDDEGVWDAVGKTSFGGLAISADEQSLWTVTLSNADRRLYRIPVANPTATSIQRFTLPDPGTGATGCPAHPATLAGELNRNLRPGAVVVRGPTVYVGLTCTAESTQSAANLRAFVYAFNTTTASFTQVANFPLTYPRGAAVTDGTTTVPATWNPWAAGPAPGFPIGNTNTIPRYFAPSNSYAYPQPWLTDIVFDEQGAMIVGLGDRFGHQSGNRNGAAGTGPIEGVAAGDVLRLRPSGATWLLENNGADGSNTTGGAGNNQGPGGGEFYYQDGYPVGAAIHAEITLGGLAQRKGSSEILTSAHNSPPVSGAAGSASTSFRSGGLIWLSNTSGQRTRSYLLYSTDDPRTFGNAAGVGDVELLCDAAPTEIGGRLWEDSDRDGVQDPGEPVVSGRAVQLYDAAGTTLIATASTAADGTYTFRSVTDANGVQSVVLPGTTYQIRVSLSQAGLVGFATTAVDADPSANGNERDSDAVQIGSDAQITLTTGVAGATSHAYDIGVFRQFSLGNRVWNDLNNDGLDNDGAGTGLDDVRVNLYLDTNDSGTLDMGDTLAAFADTTGGGYYLFTALVSGNYFVQLPGSNFAPGGPLAGFTSSIGVPGVAAGPYETAPDPDNNIDRDDNGAVNSGGLTAAGLSGGVVSLPVTLGPTASEPTGEGATPGFADPSPDNQSNATLDFGVFQPAGLGDRIWEDLNNNGVQEAGEDGISGVTVRLYDQSGVVLLAATTTNALGAYTFSLLPGDTSYVIRLDNAANYGAGGPLAGFQLTRGNQDPDDAIDSDAILPAPDTPIGPGNYPTIAAQTGVAGSIIPSFDAGFWQPLSLGNRLWNDLNNNGLDDDGTGVSGVTVNLLDADGATIADTTSNAQGYYLFTGLLPGTYTVEVAASNFTAAGALVGFTSSTGTFGSATGPYEPGAVGIVDADDNGSLAGGAIRSGPITLAVGAAPTGEPATPGIANPSTDANSNTTVDFGVFQPFSLGNRVWNDLNNDGVDNDGAGAGLDDVQVNLYRDTNGSGALDVGDTLVAFADTAGGGYYLFTTLASGDYVVQLPASNFAPGGPLAGLTSSIGVPGVAAGPSEPAPDPDNNIDGDDNGTVNSGGLTTAGLIGGVVSLPITLGPTASEPTGEDATPGLADLAADNRSNLTLDFGVVERVAPTVTVEQAAGQADPTNVSPITFRVTFSEPIAVASFTASDVTLGGSAGATTVLITQVAPNNGTTFEVDVSGMTGDGTVTAGLDAGVVTDIAGNGNSASGTAGVTYDATAPTVTVAPAPGQASPTNGTPVTFRVTFSEPVGGFATGDVAVSGSAGATTAAVSEVAPNDGTTFQITVSGMIAAGDVTVAILGGAASDAAGNVNLPSVPSTVQFIAPVPVVTGIVALDPSPTNAPSARFRLTFSEPVTGVGVADLALAVNGPAGATIDPIIAGSSQIYTVTVRLGAGDGTVRLDLVDDDTIRSAADLALGGPGVGNGSFTAGDVYRVDRTAPILTVAPAAGQSNPATALPLTFTLIASEPVSGVAADDLILDGSAGPADLTLSGAGPTYTVTVGRVARAGTVTLAVRPAAVTDLAGNSSIAASPASLTFADVQAPQAALAAPLAPRAADGGSAPVVVVVRYTDILALDAGSFGADDLVVTGPGGALTVTLGDLDAPGDGPARVVTYAVAAPGGAWDAADAGTYTVAVTAGSVRDTSGNGIAATPLGSFAVVPPEVPRFIVALPLVGHAVPALPDLVVERVEAAGEQVRVTIRNIGSGAVTTPFWVDAYIAPVRAPRQVNEIWPVVGMRGVVWGVTVPLAPGAALTLTVGDRFYRADQSNPGGPIAPGAVVYAQADSADTRSSNGAVTEGHEVRGGAYNNIGQGVAGSSIR